jgi:multidrug resistance efflux pump
MNTFVNDNDYSNFITRSIKNKILDIRNKTALEKAEYEKQMAKIKLDQAISQSDIEKATAEYEQAKANSRKAKMEQTKADLEQKELEDKAKKLEEANNPKPTTSFMNNKTKLLIGGALLIGAFFYFRKK